MLSQICSWCYFTDFPKNYTRGECGLVQQLFCLEQVFTAGLYFSQKYKRNTDRSAALLVWAGAAILNYFLLNWFSNLKLVIFVLLWFCDRDLLNQAKHISSLVISCSGIIILKISFLYVAWILIVLFIWVTSENYSLLQLITSSCDIAGIIPFNPLTSGWMWTIVFCFCF